MVRRLPDLPRRAPPHDRHHEPRTRAGRLGSTPEAGDRFGASLAGSATTVLVGVPARTWAKASGRRHVPRLRRRGGSELHRETPGVPGTVRGRRRARLDRRHHGQLRARQRGVGHRRARARTSAPSPTPGRSCSDRGTRHRARPPAGQQRHRRHPGRDDLFGAALNATGTTNRASSFLAIGIPHEDVGSVEGLRAGDHPVDDLPERAPLDHIGHQLDAGVGRRARFTGNQELLRQLPRGRPRPRGRARHRHPPLPPAHRLARRRTRPTSEGPLVNSGMVTVLPDAAGGFTATGSSLFGQNSPDMPGTGETDDGFGSSLDSANAGR